MRAAPAPRCCLCTSEGRALYAGLRDRLYSAPGEWSLRQCPREDCGLLWLDPMPIPEDVHLAYASYYTHEVGARSKNALRRLFAAAKRGYVSRRFGYAASIAERLAGLLPLLYPGRTAELDFSVMWLEAHPGGRVVDVGAGSGWLVEHLAALGWQAEGLDMDAQAVERGRARGLAMRLGGLAEQRYAEASLDALTMSHSLEHVHDPAGWLAEARRVLKPGGRLAIATPNTRSLLHRRFAQSWFALDPPRHLHLFNRAALAAALRKAGFERFRIFTSVRDANGAWLGSRAIRSTGRHDMMARQPAIERLRARLFQLSEGRLLRRDADAGEDLVALAEK